MKPENKKQFIFAAAGILIEALAAQLFAWSFTEWKVIFYGVSVFMMFAGAFLFFTSFRMPEKKAPLFGFIAAAVYICVIEAVTLIVNNVMLGGKKAWIAALAVIGASFLIFLIFSVILAKKAGFNFGKKALCLLLCVLIPVCGVFSIYGRLADIYYSNSKRRVADPVGFSSYKERAVELENNADFYISPDGSDENDGSLSAPFATFERAQKAVRELDRTGKSSVTVAVKAGDYRITSLYFGEEDGGTESCPVVWKAYGDGEAVLNGGVTIDPSVFAPVTDEEQLARLSEEARKHVMCVDLEEIGITKELYGKIYAIGSYNTAYKYDGDYVGPIYAELFVNDKRMTLARYPNEGWLKTGDVVKMGTGRESNGSTTRNENWDELRNPDSDIYKVDQELASRINGWKTFDDVWMFGFWKYTWADASTPVGEFDYENRTLSPKFVSVYGAIKGAPYYFFNVFEELDAPGEWYLDREAGVLYLYAPENLEEAVIDLSLSTDTLITAAGAKYITFDGFTVKGARGDAFYVDSSNVTVENCLIKNISGTAIIMNGSDNLAADNEITRTGKAGIYINGGDPATLTPGNSRAYNNLIHDWSEIYQTYQAAVSLGGVGNKCDHNEIYNSPHEAITYDGNNNVIEYNLIHDVCLISDDAGAVYAGRSWVSYGNVIRYNAIYDLGTPGEHSPQGIYMDDALSGQTIYGNLLVNMPCLGIQLGGGRDLTVKNNIVINTAKCGVDYDQRAYDGVVHNGWFDHCYQMWEALQNSAWQSKAWKDAFPQLDGVHMDVEREDDPLFMPNAANSSVTGNIFVNERSEVGNISENAEKFSDISGNAVYKLSALKKLFNDPANGDYTLKPGCDVFTRIPGFEQLPIEKIGRE
ncbi:MAG: right-handed parallel beta-helix repeat-containing protein [Clostridia bacterium]|nr:right-handed parallel beta-helix repeat-containing protein [Clostridia bacterium]